MNGSSTLEVSALHPDKRIGVCLPVIFIEASLNDSPFLSVRHR